MIDYDREKILDFLHFDEVATCESLHDVYELYLDAFDSYANSLTQVLIIDGELTPQEIIDGMTECDELFEYLFMEVKYPTRCNLKIPPNIRLIGEECFSWCDWLVSVSGEHVKDIEGWAFEDCKYLKYGVFS